MFSKEEPDDDDEEWIDQVTEDIDTDNRYIKAKVIAVGNLVEGLQDNDMVYYDKHAGHGITWKEKLYHVIKVGDVVLVE